MDRKERTTNKTTIRGTKGGGSVFQTSEKQWRGKIAASIETGGKIKYFSGQHESITGFFNIGRNEQI